MITLDDALLLSSEGVIGEGGGGSKCIYSGRLCGEVECGVVLGDFDCVGTLDGAGSVLVWV